MLLHQLYVCVSAGNLPPSQTSVKPFLHYSSPCRQVIKKSKKTYMYCYKNTAHVLECHYDFMLNKDYDLAVFAALCI